MDEYKNYGLQEIESIRSQMEALSDAQFRRDNPVIAVWEALGEYIKEFERELDQDHEIGARIVQLGASMQIHVQDVGYTAPSLITFSGVTSNGDPVQLIQHVNQLSFLLVSLEKREEQPYRVGFIWDQA